MYVGSILELTLSEDENEDKKYTELKPTSKITIIIFIWNSQKLR